MMSSNVSHSNASTSSTQPARRRSRRWFVSRAFLGGAGVSIGLPLAVRQSMHNLSAQEACPVNPQRFIVYYLPNGMIMREFTPDVEGENWQPKRILEPVFDYKADMNVLTGLAMAPGIPERGAYHAAATGAFITANHVAPNTTNIRAKQSIDQKIASQATGKCTRLPSLQLGIDDGRTAGDCDHGYSCAYWSNISWSSPTDLLPKVVDPGVAFDRIFEGFDPEATAEQQEQRRRQRKSVIDYALNEAKGLEAQLGIDDRTKLQQYLESVREVETRVQSAAGPAGCRQPEPIEDSDDVHMRVDAMTQIMALAVQCDATRVISFMLGNSVSERNFSFLGASGNYHGVSHHGGREGDIEKLIKIETWELEQFAKLMKVLTETPDVDGQRLLDNTCVYMSSEFSDPQPHDYRDLPTIVAGRCGGAFSPGRHIRYPDETPMANLFVNIQHAFGLPDGEFGDDGKQPLEGLS